MGNQQVATGRLRSDTYTRYEREGEDGRYVTLEQTEYFDPFDERVRGRRRRRETDSLIRLCLSL